MDKKILKSILSHDFWSRHEKQLAASLFTDEIQELFEIVRDTHTKYEIDIEPEALVPLWKDKNPVATRAEQSVIEALVSDIKSEEPLSEEVTSQIIQGLWRRDIGKKIGHLGINIAEGKDEAFDKLKSLLLSVEEGFLPDDFPEPITDDIYELLEFVSDANRAPFNIRVLREKLFGPAPGDFIIVFARPETGKTGFVISLVAGPGGFAEKGFKTLYLGNEEDPRKTKLRAMQAFGGLTKEDVIRNPKEALDTYDIVKKNIIMQEIAGWDMARVDAYIEHVKPDIVIIDQLDKVQVRGTYASTHEKLREIYIQGRAIASKHKVALFAVSQASADAEGKTVLSPDMMENSKTGKFAEADVIIGIGKFPDAPDGSADPIRFLTIGKNKISGWHGSIPCKIEAAISRYVD